MDSTNLQHAQANLQEKINNDAQKILDFADFVSTHLPLSYKFSFSHIEPLKLESSDEIKKDDETIKLNLAFKHLEYAEKMAHFSFIDAYETKQILDINSKDFANINLAKFVKKYDYPANFIQMLKDFASALNDGKDLFFKTQSQYHKLSLTKSAKSIMIAADVASVKTYFRASSSQINTLLSFEKPILQLVPKDIFSNLFFLDSTGCVNCALPHSIIYAILGVMLRELDKEFFFLEIVESNKAKDCINAPFISDFSSCNLCVSSNGVIINKNAFLDKKNLANGTLLLELSMGESSVIALKNDDSLKELLSVSFECNPQLIIESIGKNYDSGTELIKNFLKLNRPNVGKILNFESKSIISNNLSDIFSIAAFLLGFSEEFDLQNAKMALFKKANACVRERGPRIDYVFIKNNDGQLSFDFNRIFRSSFSFACAGVEDELLAYGFLDSLAEGLATLLRDSSVNFGVKNVAICGDLFANQVFLNRFTGYLNNQINLIVP